MWFYLANPRVDAVNNYRDGKDKAVLFDNCSPMTGKDTLLAFFGYFNLFGCQSLFAYYTFVDPIILSSRN